MLRAIVVGAATLQHICLTHPLRCSLVRVFSRSEVKPGAVLHERMAGRLLWHVGCKLGRFACMWRAKSVVLLPRNLSYLASRSATE